jgi:hypothetical protein
VDVIGVDVFPGHATYFAGPHGGFDGKQKRPGRLLLVQDRRLFGVVFAGGTDSVDFVLCDAAFSGLALGWSAYVLQGAVGHDVHFPDGIAEHPAQQLHFPVH